MYHLYALPKSRVTVWDADAMEKDALREGKKYLVRFFLLIFAWEMGTHVVKLGCKPCSYYGSSLGQIRHGRSGFPIDSLGYEMDAHGLFIG